MSSRNKLNRTRQFRDELDYCLANPLYAKVHFNRILGISELLTEDSYSKSEREYAEPIWVEIENKISQYKGRCKEEITENVFSNKSRV